MSMIAAALAREARKEDGVGAIRNDMKWRKV